jgi:ribosomal protein S8E
MLLTHCRYEMGRQAANTKLSTNVSVRRVRVRGGNFKFRALRLDSGNFSWGSEAVTRKTRVLDVVYNSSNNELVGFAAMPLAAAGISHTGCVARELSKMADQAS